MKTSFPSAMKETKKILGEGGVFCSSRAPLPKQTAEMAYATEFLLDIKWTKSMRIMHENAIITDDQLDHPD